jgi:alkylhydroperoxidase family enzyme
MRISGYSDEQIRDLERDVQLADGVTREVVSLACKLAKSNPRPVREELAELGRYGLDPKAAAEIVFLIAGACFANRVATFLALAPERSLERSAETRMGRFIGSIVIRAKHMKTRKVGPSAPVVDVGVLAPLIRQLPDAPIAAWFAQLVAQCFDAPALSRRTKLLILAVVARTLGCHFCEEAARVDLQNSGLDPESFKRILETLSGPELTATEGRLLDWARETVRYETGMIQKRTRALAAEVGDAVLLEAVGAAAVSNTAVRLAMLVE